MKNEQYLESNISPFLKWAGGKRWLVNKHSDLFPRSYSKYYEPFLGSGAVFFSTNAKSGILGDKNKELIDTYRAIKKDWKKVLDLLTQHTFRHSDSYYYEVRKSSSSCIYERAARFIYLNRTCWNGLYRVNLKGEFNVPRGTKNNILLPTDKFEIIAKRLENFELFDGDFEFVIESAMKGSFVFVDPPYTVKHNLNGFIKYNESLFSWSDQLRLKEAVSRAYKRGVKLVVTNANHDSIRDLYAEFKQVILSRKNVLAADPQKRGVYEELLITAY